MEPLDLSRSSLSADLSTIQVSLVYVKCSHLSLGAVSVTALSFKP